MKKTPEKSPFANINYFSLQSTSRYKFLNYEICFILSGALRVNKNKETFFMSPGDIVLFEAGHEYAMSTSDMTVIFSVTIDRQFFLQAHPDKAGHYVCNSVTDTLHNYEPLKQIIFLISNIYNSNNNLQDFRLIAQAYNLLYYLNTYHYVENDSAALELQNNKHQARITKLSAYIEANYANPLTLQETAQVLHLSTPYLSTFFKQHFGETFNSYVNKLRLSHAVEELIYTNKPITSITFDNGFPSMNAMSKLFKDTYHMTPRQYRQNFGQKKTKVGYTLQESTISSVEQLSRDEYQQLLASYTNAEKNVPNSFLLPFQQQITIPDMHRIHPVKPIWKSMINIGSMAVFFNTHIQNQLRHIQATTGFQYGRIECVMDDSLYTLPGDDATAYSYNLFDQLVHDFETQQLTPYFELCVPVYAIKVEKNQYLTIDLPHFLHLLKGILQHMINMYGVAFASKCVYEISPHIDLKNKNFEQPQDVMQRFVAAYRLIKHYLPNAKVGGLCQDSSIGFDHYHELLSSVRDSGITPDFFSIGIFPFEAATEDSGAFPDYHYTNDFHFAIHYLEAIKEIISQYFTEIPEIHIAYLGPDRISGYFLNDTLFQAAFFFRNTIDLIKKVDVLGYYRLSDIESVTDLTSHFLNGKPGLYNKFGIRKPGAHLLELFSRCNTDFVDSGEDYIILKGNLDRYMIGLCNYTHVSKYSSCSMHKNISIQEAYNIYDDPQIKNIYLKLNNLTPGYYDVVIHQINKAHGSILDEWARNAFWDNFNHYNLEYFSSVNQPLFTHYARTCTDGSLDFQFQLEPHEVIFIALLQQVRA